MVRSEYTFLEFLNDFGMEQLVGEPTRNNNLLDLILSTEPSIITNVTTVPGISDHEAVIFQLKICVEKYIDATKSLSVS